MMTTTTEKLLQTLKNWRISHDINWMKRNKVGKKRKQRATAWTIWKLTWLSTQPQSQPASAVWNSSGEK